MHRLLLIIFLLSPAMSKSSELDIFVSVPPLKTFVEKIGGQHVSVSNMVLPGHNPATYEPSPQQISHLSRADIYIRIGVPFENAWMKRLQSANPNMQILDARDGLALWAMQNHDHDDHAHGQDINEPDPHVWLSPALVKSILLNIQRILSEKLPQHHDEFIANYHAYVSELDQLEHDIREKFQDLSKRKFMVFHPSWGYFADSFGLEQVAIEKQGKEPGARGLTALINQARHERIHVIFVQPQFSQLAASQIANAINGSVIAIDPLSADYTNNLRQVADKLAAALQ